mgnify:CR=1 FL=1
MAASHKIISALHANWWLSLFGLLISFAASVVLVRWPLAETLAKEGFRGFRFMGLFDYGIKGDLPANPKRAPVDVLCAQLLSVV